MYASTLLSCTSLSAPQTLTISSSLDSIARGWSISRRSTSNSLCPSRTDRAPHVKSQAVRFSVKSPKDSVSMTSSPCRRSSARMRANSSSGAKGLVM